MFHVEHFLDSKTAQMFHVKHNSIWHDRNYVSRETLLRPHGRLPRQEQVIQVHAQILLNAR
jgi:hypothetical protein